MLAKLNVVAHSYHIVYSSDKVVVNKPPKNIRCIIGNQKLLLCPSCLQNSIEVVSCKFKTCNKFQLEICNLRIPKIGNCRLSCILKIETCKVHKITAVKLDFNTSKMIMRSKIEIQASRLYNPPTRQPNNSTIQF
jgi:hypothetical protein